MTQTHLPEAIYQEHELSSRVHAASISALDVEGDGHDPGDDRSPPLDDSDPLMIQGQQILPTTGFKAHPVGMPPCAMSQETPSASKVMHTDPNYISDYFTRTFAPTKKPSGDWPSVPLMPQISEYGY